MSYKCLFLLVVFEVAIIYIPEKGNLNSTLVSRINPAVHKCYIGILHKTVVYMN